MPNTSQTSTELLTRAVETVVPRDLAEKKLASGKPIRIYLGIDPTGSKLHVGHSVPLRKLKAFQEAGHEVIFLIGSFTAMIGDPTGRDAVRQPLTKEQVEENFKTYRKQAAKILDFDKIKVVYNHEWLEKLTFSDIMKLSSHFTVQQMLQRNMFKERMTVKVLCKQCGQPIPVFKSYDAPEELEGGVVPFAVTCGHCGHSFTPAATDLLEEQPISPNEFLYPLMQGFDSVMLDVDCELGGNDQLFNMLCGRKLQKAYGKREKFVLTTRLIEGTDGRKMSKSFDNCIYLDDAPEDMYAKVMRVRDDLIPVYMECCTAVPMTEIAEVKKAMAKGANPMDFKKRLAKEITALYHGIAAAEEAGRQFSKVFSDGGVPDDMPEIKAEKGSALVDLIAKNKLAASKSEAKRLIQQGAVKLNDVVITDIEAKAEKGILRVGKRKFARLV